MRNPLSQLILLLATALAAVAALPAAPRPNVVIVLTDDQGYGDLSCHGNPVLKTPQLDRLHAESIRLTDFHAAPICTPSRGQLMTGLDALRNGAQTVSNGRDFLRRDVPTLAELLAAGGYRCGLFGKWHLGDNYPHRPTDRGFHEVVMFPSSQVTSAVDHWDNDYLDDIYLHNNRRRSYRGYATDVFFAEAMRWMEAERAAARPFFCFIATPAAHTPLIVPERYRRPYEGLELPGVPPERRAEVARFFGMIANVDENMGALEAFLRRTGLRDDTLVIFLTDNGGTVASRLYNAGMKGAKFALTEGGHRVPCFLRWPAGRLRPPGDIAEPTQMQDLLPTLLDLCGLPPPAGARFDGISLAPRLRGEIPALPDRLLVVNYVNVRTKVPRLEDSTVIWQRWRLVQNRQLHDLATDPRQDTNVIDRFPAMAARMRAHLDTWWQSLAPTVNDFGAIVIGHDAEPETQLGPQDRVDSLLDQRHLVLEGNAENGPWHLEVARAGEYEFELRRWPREAGAAIAAGLPARPHWDGVFPAGVALPITEARFEIGGARHSRPVAVGDLAATFTVALPPGRTRLVTAFAGQDGKELCGAHFVYVRRK